MGWRWHDRPLGIKPTSSWGNKWKCLLRMREPYLPLCQVVDTFSPWWDNNLPTAGGGICYGIRQNPMRCDTTVSGSCANTARDSMWGLCVGPIQADVTATRETRVPNPPVNPVPNWCQWHWDLFPGFTMFRLSCGLSIFIPGPARLLYSRQAQDIDSMLFWC